MNRVLIFDDNAKRKIGWICFAPAIALLITLGYYVMLMLPMVQASQPAQVVDITNRNYETLFALIATMAVIGTAALIYCIVLIARVKNMNPQWKLMWILILCIFPPITTILFWAMVIRNEPKFVPTYPDIA